MSKYQIPKIDSLIDSEDYESRYGKPKGRRDRWVFYVDDWMDTDEDGLFKLRRAYRVTALKCDYRKAKKALRKELEMRGGESVLLMTD